MAESVESLGEALNVKQVAELIGCSPWTVRYRHLPQGLPHFRATANGKLIFYRDQVVRWILHKQSKGGTQGESAQARQHMVELFLPRRHPPSSIHGHRQP